MSLGIGKLNTASQVSSTTISKSQHKTGYAQRNAADAIGIAPERPPERPASPTSVLDEIGDSTQPGGIKDEAQVNAEAGESKLMDNSEKTTETQSEVNPRILPTKMEHKEKIKNMKDV